MRSSGWSSDVCSSDLSSSAPSAFSRSSFASDELVAITRAPAALANCSAKTDSPPLHWINTVEPGRVPPPTNSARPAEIGRASCRDTERQYASNTVAAETLKPKPPIQPTPSTKPTQHQ